METVNSEFYAKRVVLATGKNRIIPDIKGIKKFEGKGISYCAICDAFFFKNKNVDIRFASDAHTPEHAGANISSMMQAFPQTQKDFANS